MRRDQRSLIAYREKDLRRFPQGCDGDARAGTAIFRGIVENLGERHFEELLVGPDRLELLVDLDCDRMSAELFGRLSDALLQKCLEVKMFAFRA